MKKSVSMLVSAALLIVGLVACPSDKTEVTPPAVTPPATPPPVDVVTTELILNGGFEAETSDWNFDGTDRSTLSKTCVKTGTYYGLIALPNLEVEYNPLLSQNFNVPAQGTTLLTFWVRIESNEPTNRDVILIVKANSAILTTLTMKNSRGNYKKYTYDLTSFKGKTVSLVFDSRYNESFNKYLTDFCVDDVSAINSR